MRACLEHEHGNPSSQHAAGRRARALVETARAEIAARVGAPAERIFFTSGATEANNLALKGLLLPGGSLARAGARAHLVTSTIEHKSVLDAAHALEEMRRRGDVRCRRSARPSRGRRHRARVTRGHEARLDHAREQRDRRDSRRRCDRRSVPRARRPLPRRRRAERWQGAARPRLARRSTSARSLRTSSAGRRASARSTSLPASRSRRRCTAASRSTACARARSRRIRRSAWARRTRSPIPSARRQGSPRCATRSGSGCARSRAHGRTVTPSGARRICSTSHFRARKGESLRFALRDVAVSAGSACAADSPEASHVLTGMGLSDALASSSLRFSVGRFTSEAEIEQRGRSRQRARSSGCARTRPARPHGARR